ncbi:FYVE zinc finger-domain-containing protein [Irpex rosettiformis]|uniref:FYVE zinc finger-domain-containing protein n=1 Tax=Irpex rosettiformis TaxID=378272 RepID=A0ACB8UIP2_9APHY|nr:FYVE zinc finger-domain-containing protein [Irpex rosettiformis]
MQTPSNLPYQTYRSKRHSQNSSGQNHLQNLSPNVSPPPSRPPVYTNGHSHPLPAPFTGNGFPHSHVASESLIPLQRDFTGDSEKLYKSSDDETEKESPFIGGAPLPPVPTSGIVKKIILGETRRNASMSDVVTAYQTQRDIPPLPATSPPPTIPDTRSIIITTPSPTAPTPNSVSPPEQDTPLSPASTTSTRSSLPPIPTSTIGENGTHKQPYVSQPIAGPSSSSSTPHTSPGPGPKPILSSAPPSRKSSTFRRVPHHASTRTSMPSSPLRPQSMIVSGSRTANGLVVSSRVLGPGSQQQTTSTDLSSLRVKSPQSRPASVVFDKDKGPLPPIPNLQLEDSRSNPPSPAKSLAAPYRRQQGEIITPQPRSSSLALPQHTHPHLHLRTTSPTSFGGSNVSASATPLPSSPRSSTTPLPTPTSTFSTSTTRATTPTATQKPSTPRTYATYRPGFQPKGLYRPRTDEFLEARRTRSDVGRVERTRLERRLEKLINLHFPHPDKIKEKEKEKEESRGLNGRPGGPAVNRRASSFFDLDISSLRGKSAGDLWRGVVTQAQAGVHVGGGGNSKGDVRAAEQTITPWEEDRDVKECPLCKASFHPLTNRKHHCRLCGRIICSLPIKHPQRSEPCSLLFVADPVTGAVEEVKEGVDYGVRRRTASMQGGQPGGRIGGGEKGKERDELSPEEKFLKGVRICRECKPVLLRKQYIQDAQKVPLFTRLYEAFISLEKEIEDALPHFQELMVSLSHEERPSVEASAARKRLLEAFAQYDALAKRMRKLPCPGGPGSSQDRVHQAIILRANNFLQKNMFPLQALPKASKKPSPSSSFPSTPSPNEQPIIDPDSEVARVLQPLLEQEALLESFVEEAKTFRKFEDAQTLKANLREIRAEIDRVLASADRGVRLSEVRPK